MKKSKPLSSVPFEPYIESSPIQWDPAIEKLPRLTLRDLEEPKSTGPILPLTNGHGQVDFFAPTSLLAIMAYPRDTDARNQFIVQEKAYFAKSIDTQVKAGTRTISTSIWALLEGWIGQDGLFSLIETPARNEVWNSFREIEGQGVIVGHMLWWMVILAQAGRPTSVNRAEFLVQEWRKRIPQTLISIPEGKERIVGAWLKSIPEGKGRIMEAWSKFKPVAHLWAAYFLWGIKEGEGSPPMKREDSMSPLYPETLPKFLALAEIFRRKGLSLYSHGQRVPILDSSETWQPPADLQLPNGSLEISSLPKEAIDILKTYRA